MSSLCSAVITVVKPLSIGLASSTSTWMIIRSSGYSGSPITQSPWQSAIRDSRPPDGLIRGPVPLRHSSLPPELLQGPYLVDGGSVSEMTVCWRMSTNQTCTLKWGSSNFKFEKGSVNVTPYDTVNHLYKYTITGLNAVTPGDSVQYTLKIGDDAESRSLFPYPYDASGAYTLLICRLPSMFEVGRSMFKVRSSRLGARCSKFIPTTSAPTPPPTTTGSPKPSTKRRKKARPAVAETNA
jgi:hypothetical protein